MRDRFLYSCYNSEMMKVYYEIFMLYYYIIAIKLDMAKLFIPS